MTAELVIKEMQMAINIRQPQGYPFRESMKINVQKYIRYYNHDRLHTTLGDVTPLDYEKRNLKVSNFR